MTVGAQEGLLELLGGHLKALNQAPTINNILWILQQMGSEFVDYVTP